MDPLDPIARYREAYARAAASESFDASRAALATADVSGRPSVRFVLVKHVDAAGFVVFTNLESRKARQLRENAQAALAFHWSSTGEQVRVEGRVEALSEPEADAYFATRPRGSQLAAWASPQSQAISSREQLLARYAEVARRFADSDVPRPEFWGGVRLQPSQIEFWHDRPDRLHERVLYTRRDGQWQHSLLAP